MEVAQVEPACTVDSQPVEDPPVMKFTWTIENFTRLNTKKHYSDMFVVGGYKWRIRIFPKGNKVDYLSMYLDVADSGTLPYGWSRYAHFSLAVVNQIHSKYSIRKDTQHQFNARESNWGFTSFMLLGDLYDQHRGYLVNDTVVVEAEISVSKVLDYGSYDSKKETGYVGLKNQGANGHMNSLLQTWYHIPYFRKCVHHVPTTEDGMPSGSIPLALQRLFYKLQYSESSVATKELTKSFGPTHDLFVKHDPPELNRVLIEKLEDKMKGTIVEGTIQQLFEGHYRNYIECFNVDYKSTWKESFYDLQLDVKGCRDVYASFSKFVEVKRLEGDNQYHSEELGLQDAKKGVLFIDFPPVLQLQLKRFEYDFMQDTTVKINDRYEFPLQLDLDRENGKYLSPESDKSVRNLYTLHSVLVHSGGVHGGHYHAFVRPTLSDQWYKFGDKCVTKEDVKRALEEQYGGEDETSPDFNNTPFKLTRYSDAYMLVYVRDSDKDKVICNVDEKDIAEHLKIRLKKEQEKEKKERFKEQAHHYTIIEVVRDEDLAEQIGRDIYFDLVDHDKVRKFHIHKQTSFNNFKEEVAKEFGIPLQFQRFWIWAKRQNYTYRPARPLTPLEESQSVGQIEGVSNKMHNAELKLFLEVEFGPIQRPISLPNKTEEDILLFFKLYEPEKQELRFVGRLFVKSFTKPVEILAKFNQLAGFSLDEEIEIYEEIRFKPSVMCQRLDKMISFQSSQIEDGDIICFQKSTQLEIDKGCKYPDVPSFLDYVHNRQIVHFHSLEKPTVEDFCLELSKLHTYDDVVKKLAHHIGLEDPTKIRLTAHNCYSQQPRAQPIKYRGVEHLTEMLTHYNQNSDILYYEVFEITLPELQDLKHLKVAFHHATKDEVEIHSIRLPKQSIVGDVINVLKTKVELSHPNAELRLLEVFDHKIYKIFPNSEKIENINNQYWTLRAEEIPEEEKNLGLYHRLIHVFHFTVTVLNQMVDQVQNFGEPFVLVIHEGETLAEVKKRIQKKLQVPDEEFAKWKFAFLSLGRPEYLQDSAIVSRRFQRRESYATWEHCLGLEHSDKAPKRAHAANQAAQVTLESMASNVGHETASREIEMQNDDLDGPASPAVDRTLRRLSAAEDLLKSTSAREPSVEALAALDTVSRYARSSLDTLCTNGAYEEFKAALKLVTEQGMIHSTITSMFKDLLSSLEGEMPKYVAAVKKLAQAEDFRVEHEGIITQMGLAMQKCQERKDIVANYDAKVTELEAELVRVKAERAEAMANLETAVDEMEPLKQRFADSSLKSENLIVRQATLTLQKCSSVGTWAVIQDALKKYFKF
ncbi:ubiquitin C-terminal hydrolase 12-like isoform X1 [Pyrus communis]|uniref:ubiquitin C-terminal hydrolase 12-like isoform X1 n=1 Tax=Pyrus communis TaxID=23211 RepID=UPI0035C1E3F8